MGAVSFLVLTACGGSEPSKPAHQQSAIIDGEPSPDGIEDGVLLLRALVPGAGERICSASLVADNLAVTARHCVAYFTEGAFLCTAQGELEEGTPGAGRMGLDLPPENLEFFTNRTPRSTPVALGARVVSTLSDSACSNDLAFVVLDRPVELPFFALRRGRPALEGEVVVAVGYGAYRSDDQVLDFVSDVRRRKRDLEVAAVGPDTSGTTGAAPPRIVLVDGPSACVGDSGGPLLSQGTNALIAVHSLIEGECVDSEVRNWYTHVPPLLTWAERAFEAAGRTPTLEPDPPEDPCENGCGGAGGGDTGGSAGRDSPPTGGTATGGAAGTETGGSAGEPPDPGEDPEPTARRPAERRDSGCTLRRARDPWSTPTGVMLLLLGVVCRRFRIGSAPSVERIRTGHLLRRRAARG